MSSRLTRKPGSASYLPSWNTKDQEVVDQDDKLCDKPTESRTGSRCQVASIASSLQDLRQPIISWQGCSETTPRLAICSLELLKTRHATFTKPEDLGNLQSPKPKPLSCARKARQCPISVAECDWDSWDSSPPLRCQLWAWHLSLDRRSIC